MVSFARLSSAAPPAVRTRSTSQQPPQPPPTWLVRAAVSPAGLPLPWPVPSAQPPAPARGDPPPGMLRAVVADLGSSASKPAAMPTLRVALAPFGRPSERAVASALLFMAASMPGDGGPQGRAAAKLPDGGGVSGAGDASQGSGADSGVGGSVSTGEPSSLSAEASSVSATENAATASVAAASSSASEVPTVFHMFKMFTFGDGANQPLPSNPDEAAVDPKDWNPESLVKVVSDLAVAAGEPLDWPKVVRSLDVSELSAILTDRSFRVLLHVYRFATGSPALPGVSLVGTWSYPQAQMAMLAAALTHPGSVDWETVKPAVDSPPEDAASPFRCVPLMEALVSLDARQLLHAAMNAKPDIVLLALSVASPQSNSEIRQRLLIALISSRLSAFPASGSVIKRAWAMNKAVVEVGIQAMWQSDPTSLPRILDVVHFLGAIGDFLSFPVGLPVEFSLDLAVLAFRREHLDLDKWLTERLRDGGFALVASCVAYLSEMVSQPGYAAAQALSLEAAAIFFTCLFNSVPPQGQPIRPAAAETYLELRRVYDVFVTLNSRLSDLGNTREVVGKDKTVGSIDTQVVSPSVKPGHPAGPVAPDGAVGMEESFPGDIEAEAQTNFKNIFTGTMSIKDAVALLQDMRVSPSVHDQQLYGCMIHTMFDEYRFLDKYPERELQLAGSLFGSVIQFDLLSVRELGIALNTVLQALMTIDSTSAMTGWGTFGLYALSMFKSRLADFPLFCHRLLRVFKVKEAFPDLVAEVTRAISRSSSITGEAPSAVEEAMGASYISAAIGTSASSASVAPSVPSVSPVASSSTSGRGVGREELKAAVGGSKDTASARATSGSSAVPGVPAATEGVAAALDKSPPNPTAAGVSRRGTSGSLRPSPSGDGSFQFSTVNNDTLLNAQQHNMDVPSPDVQDKIHFVFNNLSMSNLEVKQDEFLGFFDLRFTDFLANYIVVKRVSIESNHHEMYYKFMKKLSPSLGGLFTKVLELSFVNVRVLLASEKVVSSSSDRVVLKSLASWIGTLTLARNKPVLKKDLDIKELLLDAYSNGRLIAVVPFVSKLLVTAKGSFVFKPTNPWLQAILRLLKEIYLVPDLKLNVKFELPLLTKELGIDANALEKSNLLGTRPPPMRDGNPDFTAIKKQAGIASPVRSASPISSPTRPARAGTYAGNGVPEVSSIGPSGVPIFSLTGAPQGGPGGSIPGVAPTVAELPSVVGGGTTVRASVPGSETVADLATIMANVSMTAGGVLPSTSLHGAPLHQMGAPAVVGNQRGPPAAAAAAAAARQVAAASAVAAGEANVYQKILQHVRIPAALVVFQGSPHIKQYVATAIDRSVREIISPVVERSCAIATITTRELILKDFAHDNDAVRIQKSAKQMIQHLAGSLALVTCKEPLRVAMATQMRSHVTGAMPSIEPTVLEQSVQLLCNSNLDVGSSIIESAATEKAAREMMNEVVGHVFTARAQNPGNLGGRLFSKSSAQDVVRVYEEFTRSARPPAPSQTALTGNASSANGYGYRHVVPGSTHVQVQAADGSGRLAPASLSGHGHVQQAGQRVAGLVQRHQPYSVVPQPGADGGPGSIRSMPRSARSVEGVPNARVAQPTAVTPVAMMAPPGFMAEAMRIATMQLPTLATTQSSVSATAPSAPGEEQLSTQQVLERFNSIYPQLTSAIVRTVGTQSPSAESVTSVSGDVALADLSLEHEVHQLRLQIAQAVKRSVTADEASMAVAQKVFQRLYDGDSDLHREVHVNLLESMRESSRRLSKELVSWLAYSEDAKKLNRDCIIALLRPGTLLHITSYDELVAKTCENGRNTAALDFAAFLVQRAIVDEPLSTTRELYLTLDMLSKVGRRSNVPSLPCAPKGLTTLVEVCRRVVHRPAPSPSSSGGGSSGLPVSTGMSYPDGHLGAAAKASRLTLEAESLDPQGSRETVASVLIEWHKVLAMGTPSQAVPNSIVSQFVTQARSTTLYNDETRDRFLRIGIDLVCSATTTALAASSSGQSSPIGTVPYTPVEAMVRLVAALCKTETSGESVSKGISLLNAYLQALSRVIVKASHNGDIRPHFRLFIGVIEELSVGVPDVEYEDESGKEATEQDSDSLNGSASAQADGTWIGIEPPSRSSDGSSTGGPSGAGPSGIEGSMSTGNFQVLSTIASALNACNPHLSPSFAFGWLQILASNNVMPRILAFRGRRGWQVFKQLFVSVFTFVVNHLGSVGPGGEMPASVRNLYKGVMRVLLVLLHDFPQFLCDYHVLFCDLMPTSCIQMRNLILSAYPRDMRLPDPFTPDLKVDKLADMSSEPRVLSNLTTPLVGAGLKAIVDRYLQDPSAQPASSLRLTSRLFLRDADGRGQVYNIPVIHALVLYLGQHATTRGSSGSQPLITGPSTEVLQCLLMELDAEGCYHLLNAIVNQLRYPNNHTHYFSCALLFLFRDSKDDFMKEQITRVLVERLVANRPHPWGLLITFIELIKNPMYNFWAHDFVRQEPQIERLFENVVRFCSGGQAAASLGTGASPSSTQHDASLPLAT